jgi:hypothetical protein
MLFNQINSQRFWVIFLPIPVKTIVNKKCDSEFETTKDNHVKETGETELTENFDIVIGFHVMNCREFE